MRSGTRARRRDLDTGASAGGRPVLLATMGVPFDREAATFAVDTAVESGEPLIVVNVTTLEPLPLSVMLGYDALEELTPEVSVAMRAPAALALSLGLTVERLRIRSPRPARALLELVAERHPGVLVFGPDRRAMKPRVYRRAVSSIRDHAGCLVWLPAPA